MARIYDDLLSKGNDGGGARGRWGRDGIPLLQEVLQISEIALSRHDLDIVESDSDDTRALTKSR
jgi:hypothetical protein